MGQNYTFCVHGRLVGNSCRSCPCEIAQSKPTQPTFLPGPPGAPGTKQAKRRAGLIKTRLHNVARDMRAGKMFDAYVYLEAIIALPANVTDENIDQLIAERCRSERLAMLEHPQKLGLIPLNGEKP